MFIRAEALAQTTTFDKTFTNLGTTNHAYYAKECPDGGYIVSGLTKEPGSLNWDVFAIKLNSEGTEVWRKTFAIVNPFNVQTDICIPSSGGGYVIVTTDRDTKYYIKLIKLNSSGDSVWSKEFSPSNTVDVYGTGVLELSNGDLIVTGTIQYLNKLYMLRVNPLGSIIWERTFSVVLYPSLGSRTYLLPDGNLIAATYNGFLKVNQNGDSLWAVKDINGIFGFLPKDDGKLMVLRNNMLIQFDENGTMEWQKSMPDKLSGIVHSNDGGYFILMKGTNNRIVVVKTTSAGEIIWQKEARGTSYSISKTSDGGFILAGKAYTAWVSKRDSLGKLNAVELIRPNGGESYVVSSSSYIYWYPGDGISYVHLQFSPDSGDTWTDVIRYWPAETGQFVWTVPDVASSKCLIRIYSSFNPTIADTSDSTFSIIGFHHYEYIAANEIFMWIGNNGDGSHDPRTDGNGFYWPGGINNTGKSAVFEDGLLWGGKINGQIRVNGNTHRQGVKAGNILPNGTAADPNDIKFKIFKIKKGWEYLPAGPERDKYEYNYFNWPVDIGAPWEDLNGNGVYTVGIDKPKFVGDEVLYYVANDLDTIMSHFTYGSLPIGLEFQTTTYALNRTDFLKDVVFKKYKIINKSPYDFTDVYLSYWTDDDLGYANDDYVGCDSTLNLGFTYNGDNQDGDGSYQSYGINPPAVGHMFVQGPVVPAQAADSAFFNGKWIKGKKNLPMTSFVMYIGGSSIYRDPQQGSYNGTLEFYNNMQGLIWNGNPFINPITGLPEKFILSGDPEAGIGWYEAGGWPSGPYPSDRRFLITSGTLNIAPGDTQEVVIAIFMAQGSNHLNSVTKLKQTAALIQQTYYNNFVVSVDDENLIVDEFHLYQNYPNPFNPETNIRFVLPGNSHVNLTVYNMLGEKVATLVDEFMEVGIYERSFDGTGFASGMYIYVLKAGDIRLTKKMLLLK